MNMEIKLYNTLSKKIEIFKPLKEGAVSMYSCGPTVYDTPHIGNYRTFVMNDLLRRVFEYNDYSVTQIMNITDVDDKTIKRSSDEGVPLKEITEKYEKLFIDGLKSLNILLPHKLLRATDNIQEMIDLVEILLKNGSAYKADDGIYMSIEKVKNYGKLAGIDLTKEGSFSKERIVNDEYDKNNTRDFALWKFKSENDGENYWKAPFGEGRPGWHIECSAMAMKELGPTIDIHTGGADLIFPHHTNEIAQSESATGKKFVDYWMHGAFMTMSEDKMSKSKGNIIKLENFENETISPLSYRYWLLTAQYRSPIDFTYSAVRAAQNALIRLISTLSGYPEDGAIIPAYNERFLAYINDDLDLPKAVALSWDLLKDDKYSDADKRATILDFDRIFGLNLDAVRNIEEEKIPAEVTALAEARKEARKNKEWKKADALRKEIESRGFTVMDTEAGFGIKHL